METDPHATLGLSWDASEADIKRAFRSLAQQLHPDRTGNDPASEERLKLITAAYHRLKDAGFRLPRRGRPFRDPVMERPEAEPDYVWPTTWSDGTPIHYPTPAEIESLLRDAGRPSLRRKLRALSPRVGLALQRVAAVAFGLLLVGGVAMILLIMARDLHTFLFAR